jgi:uncharacterized membrane protein
MNAWSTVSPTPRSVARWLLGAFLVVAGVGHLSFARRQFQAQVPSWMPLSKDQVVVGSGFVEIALGTAVAFAPPRRRSLIGKVAAAFFVAVFPGNVAQYTEHADGLGLDTDRRRALRLPGQPLLVAWALWATRSDPTN